MGPAATTALAPPADARSTAVDLATRQRHIEAERAALAEQEAKAAELTAREYEAYELYVLGATWGQIARKLGVKSHTTAMRYVRSGLAKRASQVDRQEVSEARALMLDRAERLIAGFLPVAVGTGDDKAAKIVLGAMQTQARLLGLDAPKKHEHEHHLSQDTPAERKQREQAITANLVEFNNRTIEGETV